MDAMKSLNERIKVGRRYPVVMGAGHSTSSKTGEPDMTFAGEPQFEGRAAVAALGDLLIRELYTACIDSAGCQSDERHDGRGCSHLHVQIDNRFPSFVPHNKTRPTAPSQAIATDKRRQAW